MTHKYYELLVQAYTDWLIREIRQGRMPYYINIMFHQLPGYSHDVLLSQMQKAIYSCFYPTLCKQFAWHPHRKSQEHRLPRAWLFADLPQRWDEQVNINRGLHYNGCVLLPAESRLKDDFCEHIQQRQSLYVDSLSSGRLAYHRGGIQRVHAKPINRRPHVITRYAMKTLEGGRVDYDTGIILPRLASELKASPITLDAKSRFIKDMQAQTNLSDQTAERLYLNAG